MASDSTDQYSVSNNAGYFQRKYGKEIITGYDASTPVMSQTKKTFGLSGDAGGFRKKLELTLGGGYGAGSLPVASSPDAGEVAIPRKNMYQRTAIEREAIYASKDQGAVEAALQTVARKTPESFANFVEACLFMDKATSASAVVGSGKVGSIAAGGVSGSGPWTLTLTAGYTKAFFHVGILLNIGTGNTGRFRVTAVDHTAGTIIVARRDGSDTPTAADELFIQGSEDNTIISLEGALSFTSGETLYGLAHQANFEPGANIDGSAAALSLDLLDKASTNIAEKVGMGVDRVYTSYLQWRKLSATLQAQKRYETVQLKSSRDPMADVGFKGLQYVTPTGTAMIVPSRYISDTKAYLVNSNFMELMHAQGFGFFTDDRSVFMRIADQDAYESRFGGYMNTWIMPTYHGRLFNLIAS